MPKAPERGGGGAPAPRAAHVSKLLDAAPPSKFSIALDRVLVAAGVSTAFGATLFACVMLLQRDRAPGVNGMQYLAIFAQPSGAANPTAGTSAPKGSDRAPETLDMTPLGAIGARETLRLVAARPEIAWLREGAKIFSVRPGDVIPNVGGVAQIQPRAGGWALLDAAGVVLVASDGLVEPTPTPANLFRRGMIFDPPH